MRRGGGGQVSIHTSTRDESVRAHTRFAAFLCPAAAFGSAYAVKLLETARGLALSGRFVQEMSYLQVAAGLAAEACGRRALALVVRLRPGPPKP